MENNERITNDNNKGVSFVDLLMTLKKYWIAICCATVFVTVVSTIYSYGIKKPVYSTQASIIIVQNTSDENSGTMTEAFKKVNTLKEFIRDDIVIDSVIEQLIFEGNYSEVTKKDLKQIISNGLAISCEQDSIIISIKFTTSTEKIPENKIERFSLEVVNYTINKTQELLNEKVINPETGKSTYKYGNLIANSVRKLSPATKCEVRRGSIKTPIKAFFLSLIASYVICFFIYIIKKNNELYNKVQ